MVEAVGFRVTSDVVGLICIFFALLYFVVAGGASAFRETCRANKQSTSTSKHAYPTENDDDFNKVEDAVSCKSLSPASEKV